VVIHEPAGAVPVHYEVRSQMRYVILRHFE